MVFRRRDRRPWWLVVRDLLWPRGGWARAARYVQHRLRRLPDTPEKICRGIWAGVFTTFTPFYGLHFVVAAAVATLMRGNLIAALLATFFGNPLTYVPIGVVSLQTGYWLLGMTPRGAAMLGLPPPGEGGAADSAHHGWAGAGVLRKFSDAGGDLWHNFTAMFTPEVADWDGLARFYDEVFFPYMIGGILPGIVVATGVYYVSLPLVRAYQNRRKRMLRAKLEKLKPGGGGS